MPSLTRAPALRPLLKLQFCVGARRCISNALYDSTLKNLKIDHNTRVIYQGFTGKAATVNALQSIQYGTNIVGGVTPGKSGIHLDLPLFPSVDEAARALKPTATAIFVAAPYAASAIEDAIKAEIPLIVAVAEHVPLHDMLRVHSILRTQSASRLVGANCPGIVNPRAHCRIGFMPHPSFLPGSIGIVAKSGTLSYEAVASTTRVGLGQSLVVGMGGDAVAGTTLADAVEIFLEDEGTEGIVIIGEIGGAAEMDVAEVIQEYRFGGGKKPIMALVSGKCAVNGRVMGHAGALRGFHPTVEDKIKALEAAGVVMVEHPGMFGEGMMKLLGRAMPREPVKGMGPGGPGQRRGLHTMTRRRTVFSRAQQQLGQQKRSLYTEDPKVTLEILKQFAPEIPASLKCPSTPTFGLGISINGTATRAPALLITPAESTSVTFLPFDYLGAPPAQTAFEKLGLSPNSKFDDFCLLIKEIYGLFMGLKVYTIFFRHVSASGVHLHNSKSSVLRFDHTLPPPITVSSSQIPEELEAAKHGIVYITLPGEGNIGTLVNGAGLAMNTCDVINARGGSPANFLDTGGKATGRTVVEGLRTVLADKRVKAVFVNIFGGLTDCAMIAEGILMAYKELEMNSKGVHLVVRLRGTNEEIGQKMILDSGLPVFAFDNLDGAVEKVIALARAAEPGRS
ncbi:succinyl-CoA synthetase-like protein [Wilcoxina mikolae CBS 423.85]|nr:succinyl-CoA synthetase-like protein [Wilcoxina mikolae CBS 423.85]